MHFIAAVETEDIGRAMSSLKHSVWEYKILYVKLPAPVRKGGAQVVSEVETAMNGLGAQGWELVSVKESDSELLTALKYYICLFKRLKD
jgi:hypothetical protein